MTVHPCTQQLCSVVSLTHSDDGGQMTVSLTYSADGG